MNVTKVIGIIYNYSLSIGGPNHAAEHLENAFHYIFSKLKEEGFTEERFESYLQDHLDFIEACKLKDQKESA